MANDEDLEFLNDHDIGAFFNAWTNNRQKMAIDLG